MGILYSAFLNQKIKNMEPLLETIELEFTSLEFYKNFVVSRVKEDVVFSKVNTSDLVKLCAARFPKNKFVYISHRIHSYNVDPTIYLNLEKVANLSGIAIVSKDKSSLTMAFFEKNFAKLPFEIFTEHGPALVWTREILSEEEKN